MVVIKLNPTSRKSQADRNKLFQLVGECVAVWSFVDRALFDLFQFALAADPERASIVYFRSPNLGQRLSLLDALLSHVLKDAHTQKRWKQLYKEVEGLLSFRNFIAHHPPKMTGTSRGTRAVYTYSIHFEPAKRLTAKRILPDVTTKDLAAHRKQVEKLELALCRFAGALKPRM